jgi:hypothetical protein
MSRPVNELNNMIKDNEFSMVLPIGMKLPKIDAIRDALKVINVAGLREMLTHGIRKAKENKAFDNGTIDGLVIAAMYGTQVYNSDKKDCEHCLKAYKKGKTEQRNFHSIVVLSTIGDDAKLVIDFEPYRSGIDEATKDEGELTTAKRLIQRVSDNHKKLIDVIVYDAIACNSVWMNTCIEAGMDTIVRVKSNNVESIKYIKKEVNKSDEVVVWMDIKGFENVKVYEGNFYMKSVEQPLRFVKFLI